MTWVGGVKQGHVSEDAAPRGVPRHKVERVGAVAAPGAEHDGHPH